MQPQNKPYLTPEEYLAIERAAEYKSEYYGGEMFALAGASRRHNLVTLNIGAELRARLRGKPCISFANDMRVKVDRIGKYTYPDVVVACGEPRFESSDQDTLLNPVVIVEVLSESTEAYDRGQKFEHYRGIESLREYLLVAQDRYRVEQYLRQDDGRWIFTEISGADSTLVLSSIGCEIPLNEIYHLVELAGTASATEPGE